MSANDALQKLKNYFVGEIRSKYIDKSKFAKINSEFPTKSDYFGAMKALFTLHYTYRLNLTSLVTDGILSFYDSKNNQQNYQVQYSRGARYVTDFDK